LHAYDIYTGYKNYLNQIYGGNDATIIFEYRAYLYEYMKFGTGYDYLIEFSIRIPADYKYKYDK
jgi:hypothetical protein